DRRLPLRGCPRGTGDDAGGISRAHQDRAPEVPARQQGDPRPRQRAAGRGAALLRSQPRGVQDRRARHRARYLLPRGGDRQRAGDRTHAPQGPGGATAGDRWAPLRGARQAVLRGRRRGQGRPARNLRAGRARGRDGAGGVRALAWSVERRAADGPRLSHPARRQDRAAGIPFPRRGPRPDQGDALPEGGGAALPGLAVQRPARAALGRGVQLNPAVFREYDIRGVAERDFDADFARRLGAAFATMAAEQGATLLGVGRDCRLTSDGYAAALREGIAGAGVDVSDLGVCPTPLVYFAIWHWGLGGGVQVTGSHNPPDYNGFKLCVGPQALHGEQIQALRHLIETGPLRRGTGRIQPREVVSVYQDHVAATVGTFGRQISVVVDAGNGTAGPV